MLKKNIKYTDYNGVEREETFMFNLSKAEIMEMELGTAGGLAEKIQKLVQTKDSASIVKTFKEIILKSYGVKSDDGKRFLKVNSNGESLAKDFEQTEAYSELFMELSTDADSAANFINGIIPNDVKLSDAEIEKIKKEQNISVSTNVKDVTIEQ